MRRCCGGCSRGCRSPSIEPTPGDVRHPLAALTARTPDDPAIALLDAWACVADVLTFYQERIANEGFLRTATERRSILELARLIGYELNPGVAASVHLAYSVDTATGAPAEVIVPAGSRVQSVPGQNELPQTFETSADLLARAEWNVLRPRLLRPSRWPSTTASCTRSRRTPTRVREPATLDVAETYPLDLDTPLPSTGTVAGIEIETLYVDGTTTNLKAGDVVLLVGRHDEDSPPQTLTRTIRRVQEEDAQGRTRVDFDAAVPPRATLVPITRTRAIASIRRTVLDAQVGHPCRRQPVVERSRSHRVDERAGLGSARRARLHLHDRQQSTPEDSTRPGAPGAFAMRTRAGIFGHNAPAFRSLTDGGAGRVRRLGRGRRPAGVAGLAPRTRTAPSSGTTARRTAFSIESSPESRAMDGRSSSVRRGSTPRSASSRPSKRRWPASASPARPPASNSQGRTRARAWPPTTPTRARRSPRGPRRPTS